MKNTLYFLFLSFILISSAKAQTTVSIRLNPSTGEGAYVSSFFPNGNFSAAHDLVGIRWTSNGTPYTGRTYFRYDLSAIPPNAVVTNATLSLFANPSPLQPAHSTLNGSNESLIQQVTGNWDQNSLTWNNAPATTINSQAVLPMSNSVNDDYLQIDVTQMVNQMVLNPATNNGFMIRLSTESPYRSMNFASIQCPDTSKQPLLEITYSTNLDCMTYKLDTLTGEGSYISSFFPNNNYSFSLDLVGVAWTSQGTPYFGRSFFKYDLSGIPVNASVAYAYLSLYSNPTPLQPAHSTLNGSNAALIQKVVAPWNENTITWNNSPSITTLGEIVVGPTTPTTLDFPNIDVTQLISDMVNNPATNYGFLFRLQTEVKYRSMNFASLQCADSTKRPRLVVCYSDPNSIGELNNSVTVMNLYPNPSYGTFNVAFNRVVTDCSVKMYNLLGELIFSETFTGTNLVINPKFASGSYILKCNDDTNAWTKKIVLH